MSAALVAEITDTLKRAVGEDSGLDTVLKIDFRGEGVVRIDGRSVPNQVSNEDGPADCTVSITPENLVKLKKGELDPTLAYFTGKIKVSGDMSIVMKLAPLMRRMAQAE